MRFLIKLIFFCCFFLVSLTGAAWWWANSPLNLHSAAVEFRVLPGSSLRGAVNQIKEAGVEIQADLFALLAKLKRSDTGLKAGSYSIKTGITPFELLSKLTRGEVTQGELTLVEGWTFRQWRNKIDQHPDLRHEMTGLNEAQIIQKLGINVASLEGWLFPDTYLFDKQSSDLELLSRAHRTMQKRLESEWAKRDAGLPYKTPYEALIMASIVEKETGRDADRPMVASVFVNRLRVGMLLQTDPTVIYGLGSAFDGNLRKQHLRTDTPYNTYTRAGLPPTPIAMPGNNSLLAAMNPASSDALYFVARGDGSSQFSRTLDEHNQAVNKYQRGAK